MADSLKIIDDFCIYIETSEGLSLETSRKYRGYIEKLLVYCEGRELNYLQVDADQLEDFTGLYLHELGLKPLSRKAVVSCVRKFYWWLAKKKVTESNPAASLPQPKAGRRIPNKLELENFQKLIMQPGLDDFKAVRDTTIIAVLGGCGLRVSGLVNINVSDLIFTHDKNGNEELVIKVKEKGEKERLIPAPPDVWALIRAYLGHDGLKEYDRSLDDGDQVLFVKMNDRTIKPHEFHGENVRISRKGVYKMIIKHGEDAGIPSHELGPHAMRHLFGTELTESDVDPVIRQALMGHEDTKSQAIYNHMAMKKLRKDSERGNPLGKIVSPVSELLKQIRK